ncbi:hypothetical protein LC724_28540 [Blautia sp. RD014234]|nr:hypothetical protein [Blautia parvula]
MYAQSLVTIFDECIIANLTGDYYMNCQKDAMWTDIPEQGNFRSGKSEVFPKGTAPG